MTITACRCMLMPWSVIAGHYRRKVLFSLLSVTLVCIRTSTERPEALDKGCFILAGIDKASLLQAVDTAVEMNRNGDNGVPVPDYMDRNVSTKVVKLIQSYTGIVNKIVWRKS